MWFSGERSECCGDLLYVGPHVGGGTSHVVSTVVVSGVGAGDGISEVAFHPGQDGVSDPVRADPLDGNPWEHLAEAFPQPVTVATMVTVTA